jgi:hypothetical protein
MGFLALAGAMGAVGASLAARAGGRCVDVAKDVLVFALSVP